MLLYSIFYTCVGWMAVGTSEIGLQKVILPRETKADLLNLFQDTAFSISEDNIPDAAGDLIRRIKIYLQGEAVEFPDKLDLSTATKFQRSVWSITQTIDYGETRSYGWIAQNIGCPGGARAVGQAMGKNPVPIVIPCHRVISSNGGLGGFTGGLYLKEYLLNIEKHQQIS